MRVVRTVPKRGAGSLEPAESLRRKIKYVPRSFTRVTGPNASYEGFAVSPDASAGASTARIPSGRRKSAIRHPRVLLRLNAGPIVCFLQLTRSSNLTMLRLRRIKIERRRQPDRSKGKGGDRISILALRL